MSYRTSEDFAKETSALHRYVKGMIRRMAVKLTSAARWQVLGYRGGTGGDETVDVEPFTGIGFYSRPPSSGKPEAIMVSVGGSKTPAVVATRDEATRKAIANLAAGETAIYNDVAIVVVKANGTVEIRLANGTALALATKADLDALAAYCAKQFSATGTGHTHTLASGGTVTLTTVPTAAAGSGSGVPAAAGTSVLKGQ